MAYTTLEAVRDYGEFESDASDGLLSALIDASKSIIDKSTGRKFDANVATDRYFSRYRGMTSLFRGNKLFLDTDLADKAVTITDSPSVIYLPENEPPYHAIIITEGAWAHPEVIVNGYWGYSKVAPYAIEQVCIRIVMWLDGLKDPTQATTAIVTPEGQVLLPQGLPVDIKLILGMYQRIVLA